MTKIKLSSEVTKVSPADKAEVDARIATAQSVDDKGSVSNDNVHLQIFIGALQGLLAVRHNYITKTTELINKAKSIADEATKIL